MIINLKTINRKHFVKVDGKCYEFDTLGEALRFIQEEHRKEKK